jgi:hypothetical protein
VCLRALVEAAGFAHQGVLAERGDHPWVMLAPPFAARLRAVTGTPVAALPAFGN